MSLSTARRMGAVLMLTLAANATPALASPSPTPLDLPVPDGRVNAIARIGDRVYLGGTFESVGGVARHNLVAIDLPSRTVVPGWAPEVDGDVAALTPGDGVVYAAGTFHTVDGRSRPGVAALDKVTGDPGGWRPQLLDPGTGGPLGQPQVDIRGVSALAVSGSTVYLAEMRKASGRSPDAAGIAAVGTSPDAPVLWRQPVSSGITGLQVSGDRVYLGGGFATVNGASRQRLAAVNAATGGLTDFWAGRAVDGTVRALGLDGGTLYVGGEFTTLGGAARSGLGAVDLATGDVTAFDPSPAGPIDAIDTQGPFLYAGGRFSSIGGHSRLGLAEIDRASGDVTAWDPSLQVFADAITATGGFVFAGGTLAEGLTDPHRFVAFTPDDTGPGGGGDSPGGGGDTPGGGGDTPGGGGGDTPGGGNTPPVTPREPKRSVTFSCSTSKKNGKKRVVCTVLVRALSGETVTRVVLVRGKKSYKTGVPVRSGGGFAVRWTPRPSLPAGSYTIRVSLRGTRGTQTWEGSARRR